MVTFASVKGHINTHTDSSPLGGERVPIAAFGPHLLSSVWMEVAPVPEAGSSGSWC